MKNDKRKEMYLKIIYPIFSDSLPREILLELWMTFQPESSKETLPNNHIFPEAYRYMNFHFPYLFESCFFCHARRTDGNTKVLWMYVWILKYDWMNSFQKLYASRRWKQLTEVNKLWNFVLKPFLPFFPFLWRRWTLTEL